MHVGCEYCFKYPLLFQLIVQIRFIAYILHNKKNLKCYIWLMLRHYIAVCKNYVQLSPGNQELLVSWGQPFKNTLKIR